MFFALATSALAWDLAAPVSWPDAVDHAALRPGEDVVATVTYDALTLRDPVTNAVLQTLERGGGPLAWMPDGSGIVQCATGGTYYLPYDAVDGFGTEVQLSPGSCQVAVPTASAVAIVLGEVQIADASGLTSTGLVGDLVGVRGDLLLVGTYNQPGATEWDGAAGDTVDFGMPVGALAGFDGAWMGGAEGTIVMIEDGAAPVSLEMDGRILGGGDLDGDGLSDVLGFDDEGAWVRDSLTGTFRAMPGVIEGTLSIVPGSEDCAAVLSVDNGYHWHASLGCHGDVDGDGATSEQGDCDDSDPARHPGATEVCDRVDDNCDGSFVDLPLEAELVRTLDEGDVVELPLGLCDEVASYASVPEPCWVSGELLHCPADDDGRLQFQVGLGEQTLEVDLTIENVAPTLADTLVVVPPGQVTEQLLAVDDPGLLDTHTFELLDGPGWVELGSDGLLVVDAGNRERSVELEVQITDDDGGVFTGGLDLEVRELSSPDTGGCDSDVSCSVSGLAPVGIAGWFALLLMRRRPLR